KNGCGIATLPISVIGYPKFFTPNDDGINDFWQIQGISDLIQPNSSIHIFDRYGKLLKQLSPSEVGWNGTFNGYALSTADYRFTLFLQDDRIILGHFSFIRLRICFATFCSMRFNVYSAVNPTGDQPPVIQHLVGGINA